MTPLLALLLTLALSYSVGGISGGWILVRLAGRGDLRTQGSGVTGATNAGRVMGTRGFLVVMLFDAAKAAAAVVVAQKVVAGPWAHLAFPAVVAGHIWPPWLRFKGGRGAAPLLGGLIAFNPILAGASVAVGLAVIAVSRKRFLGSAVAFSASLLLQAWMIGDGPNRFCYLLSCGLVVLAHRGHIAQIVRPPHGAEHGIQGRGDRG